MYIIFPAVILHNLVCLYVHVSYFGVYFSVLFELLSILFRFCRQLTSTIFVFYLNALFLFIMYYLLCISIFMNVINNIII